MEYRYFLSFYNASVYSLSSLLFSLSPPPLSLSLSLSITLLFILYPVSLFSLCPPLFLSLSLPHSHTHLEYRARRHMPIMVSSHSLSRLVFFSLSTTLLFILYQASLFSLSPPLFLSFLPHTHTHLDCRVRCHMLTIVSSHSLLRLVIF